MKVLVIGGTGLVGSYLLPGLVAKGYKTFALTRSENKLERIQKLGAIGIVSDILQTEGFLTQLPEKPDILVLLAMPGVQPGKRVSTERKEELRKETNGFFRYAMDLAIQWNIPVILPGGTSYRTGEDETADESWPIRRVGITEIGKDTDVMVNEAIKTGYPKVIQLIYGRIYGNGSMFRFMFNMVEKGRMKIIGKGDNYIPNIHASDAASAIILAIEKLPIGEKFIITDDTPLTQEEFTCYMAELMHKKRPGRIPGFIVRLAIGKDLYEVISTNCKVTNEKAKKILGWRPQYPSYKEGLAAAIGEMKKSKPYFS